MHVPALRRSAPHAEEPMVCRLTAGENRIRTFGPAKMVRRFEATPVDLFWPHFCAKGLTYFVRGIDVSYPASSCKTVGLSLDFSLLYRNAGICRGMRGLRQAVRPAETARHRARQPRKRPPRHGGAPHPVAEAVSAGA